VHLWFARNESISIRDQLVTQLMLAIASGELAPGKRLPSTRAFARRFQLHANTVSAAYQQLQDLGWVESIHGGGVYVRAGQDQSGEAQLQALDRLVLDFLRGARSAGLTASAAQARLDRLLALRPRRFVFVHPDEGLRAIVCQELRQVRDYLPYFELELKIRLQLRCEFVWFLCMCAGVVEAVGRHFHSWRLSAQGGHYQSSG